MFGSLTPSLSGHVLKKGGEGISCKKTCGHLPTTDNSNDDNNSIDNNDDAVRHIN